MHGKPVFPIMIKKLPRSKGKTAVWKETIESGVRVNPTSLNRDGLVKKPLRHVSSEWDGVSLVYVPPDPRSTITINNRSVSAAADNPRNQTHYA